MGEVGIREEWVSGGGLTESLGCLFSKRLVILTSVLLLNKVTRLCKPPGHHTRSMVHKVPQSHKVWLHTVCCILWRLTAFAATYKMKGCEFPKGLVEGNAVCAYSIRDRMLLPSVVTGLQLLSIIWWQPRQDLLQPNSTWHTCVNTTQWVICNLSFSLCLSLSPYPSFSLSLYNIYI